MKKLVVLFSFIVVFAVIFSSKIYASTGQFLIEKNSAKSDSSQVTYDVKINLSGGTNNEKIDYVKTVVTFPTESVQLVSDPSVSSESRLERVLGLTNMKQSNSYGKIVMEMGAMSAGAGPSANGVIILGSFSLNHESADLKTSQSQVVNNESKVITVTDASSSSQSASGGILSSLVTFIKRLFNIK